MLVYKSLLDMAPAVAEMCRCELFFWLRTQSAVCGELLVPLAKKGTRMLKFQIHVHLYGMHTPWHLRLILHLICLEMDVKLYYIVKYTISDCKWFHYGFIITYKCCYFCYTFGSFWLVFSFATNLILYSCHQLYIMFLVLCLVNNKYDAGKQAVT